MKMETATLMAVEVSATHCFIYLNICSFAFDGRAEANAKQTQANLYTGEGDLER